MPGSLRIGRLFGIDIAVHISWLIIAILLSWSLETGWFTVRYPAWPVTTSWAISILATLLLFLSILLHELAHSLIARARGLSVKNITLFIFGGASNIEHEPADPNVEFQMALVGPLTSIALGGLAGLFLFLCGGGPSPLVALLEYLAFANLFLGVFNLLPGYPLDGGRVLHAVIWKWSKKKQTATRIATRVGQLMAYMFIFAGLWFFFLGSVFDGLWIGFIGWFLLQGALSAHVQVTLESMFKGVHVRDVMQPNPATVPANISLHKLVDEFLLPHGWRSAFVLQNDQLAGVIALRDVRHVPREQWAQTPVGFVMLPLTRLHTVKPEQNLNEIVPLMVGQDINQLPVLQEDRLVGSISREDILRFIEIRRSLGLERESA